MMELMMRPGPCPSLWDLLSATAGRNQENDERPTTVHVLQIDHSLTFLSFGDILLQLSSIATTGYDRSIQD